MKHAILRGLSLASILFALALPAAAQNVFPTPNTTTTVGVVDMCLNASGFAVPIGSGCAGGVKAEGVCTIASGGTAQQCISAAQNTNGFLLYVSPGFSNTDPIYCSDTTTTTTASSTGALPLNPSTATASGGSFSLPGWFAAGHAVWCIASTTGDKVGWHVN